MSRQNDIKFTGRVSYISPVQTRGANGFELRQLVVEETEGQYPQSMLVEFSGKRIGEVDGLTVGAVVTVAVNCKAREYNGRWFGSLNGWKVEQRGATQDAQPEQAAGERAGGDDNIPF